MSNFNKCLEIVLHHEGGYVNHPKDPGGMTNMGVTKRVYEEWVGYSVSENTMQNLKEEDVAPIYKNNYWDRVKGDQLPNGLDLVVFDFGVNAGTGRAAKYLQAMIHLQKQLDCTKMKDKITMSHLVHSKLLVRVGLEE